MLKGVRFFHRKIQLYHDDTKYILESTYFHFLVPFAPRIANCYMLDDQKASHLKLLSMHIAVRTSDIAT